MKTINFLALLFFVTLFSCSSNNKSTAQKVSFGIYETVKVNQLPATIAETFKTVNIKYEKDQQLPTLGYILKTDKTNFVSDFQKEHIKLLKTIYPVDKEENYIALVAVKSNPYLEIKDISDTKISGKNVEIHFNMEGAKKWAEMTKNNIGNMVVFTIDNQIYTMPFVNAEIKNGTALINGLENETQAKQLSELLNTSIK